MSDYELLQYKCPNCGGTVEFDSNTQKMKCPFCDSEFDVEALKQMDEILNKHSAPDDIQWDTEQHDWEDTENISVFVCQSCGGEIIGDENTAATTCPYCGNNVVMSGRLAGVLKPDYVIPFKLDKKAAKDMLKSYISSKKFAPNTFKSENRLKEIKGLYVPFWLFDSDISAAVQYDATRVRTWSDSNYRYTETSHFDVYREGDMSFANIPVDGSTKMPDDLMESIEPFNFDEAVDFQTAYLSGYLADKYDVKMEESIDRANQRVKVSAEQTLLTTVNGYSSVTPRSSAVTLNDGRSKYAFYPVWILNTTYQGENYTFAMNGQTGKFVGNLPVSKAKLAGLFCGSTAAITAVVFIVGRLLGLL
ncbi:MAG: hypothetical protein K6C14_07735 [Eubacterium sp.]|nr:hypothetical protein [Eubacterium sp.]